MKPKMKRIFNTLLIILLILGILTSGGGIGALAYSFTTASDPVEEAIAPHLIQDPTGEFITNPHTAGFEDLPNEIALNDDVVILTDEDSDSFSDAIIDVETESGYYETTTTFTLSGENHESVDELSYGDYFYVQGDEDSVFMGDRIYQVDSIWSSDGNTNVRVTEPYFEDVFESMEVCISDMLTEENFVAAHYAEGVTSYFGDIDTQLQSSAETSLIGDSATYLNETSSSGLEATYLTATDSSTDPTDLIVEIDYDFNKKDDDNDDSAVSTSFGIQGKFGIRDLAAHFVSDIPSILSPKELYVGVSGELVADVHFYGKVEASSDSNSKDRDFKFLTLEGLSQKRFPIAVFQFRGTTPVYITNKQFDNETEKVFPNMFLIVYADWEGKISLELSGGFEYSNGFNSGLRLIKDGEFCVSFEDYPYQSSYPESTEDNIVWDIGLGIDADTELTLLGGSVLFYVGGINIAEFSLARLGIQAECKDLQLSADSENGIQNWVSSETELYIRGFLKFIEAKAKLKAQGKGILSKLSTDVDFEFSLLDLTLFELGVKPDKYKPTIPVSATKAPTEFESVITVVSDVSGSMDSTISTGQTKLEASKEAANAIVETTRNWATNYEGNFGIGLVQFASDAETVAVPHTDYDFLKACIEMMGDGGGTSIYKGIDNGVAQLNAVNATNKVMILMTDGQDSNESDALDSARKAANAGIKIYTIGFGSDVDESILQQIASATGGEYRFANTDSIIGIMGGFMYAQQSTNSEVLTDFEGSVAEGEKSEAQSFKVDSMSGDLIATTVWPGSFLDTIVTDPNGRVVDTDYPGATIDETSIPSMLTVKNPIEGEWTIEIEGVETSYEQEPFYTIVSFKEVEQRKLNEPMTTTEKVAAYCIPIGLYTTFISIMLLICVNKKQKKKLED